MEGLVNQMFHSWGHTAPSFTVTKRSDMNELYQSSRSLLDFIKHIVKGICFCRIHPQKIWKFMISNQIHDKKQ